MRKITILSMVFIMVLFPFTFTVFAGDYYVEGIGGYTISPEATFEESGASFDMDLDETFFIGLKLGYSFPEANYFSLELEYNYIKPDIETMRTTSGSDWLDLGGDVKVSTFMVNGILEYPEGRIRPYIGAGIGVSAVDVDLTLSGNIGGSSVSATGSGDDTCLAWQVLVGTVVTINEQWSADIGYRYFSSNPEWENLEIDIKTSLVTFGLRYSF